MMHVQRLDTSRDGCDCSSPEFFDIHEDHRLWRCAHWGDKRVALIVCDLGHYHVESIGLDVERHVDDLDEAFRLFFEAEALLISGEL